MSGPRRGRTKAFSLLLAGSLGATFALGTPGCEMFAHVDRDLLDGGSGGAAVSSSATSTTSTGGAASCLLGLDCPGSDTECTVRTCDDGVCGTGPVALGTPTMNQVAGDCQRAVCDGKGGEIDVADDTDLPIDLDPCTDDVCDAGIPTNPLSGPGKPCVAPGGKVCNGAGACVACVVSLECEAGFLCINNVCSSCFDGKQDGTETDVDCGGPCAPCAPGSHCVEAGDCQTGVCAGFPGICQGTGTGTGGAGGGSTTTSGTGGHGGATSGTGGMGGMGGMGGASSTSASSAGGVTSSTSSTSSASSASSSSSSSGVVVADVFGVFLGGSVVPGTGGVRVQGHLVWHAKVSEGSGSVRVNGWLR